MIRANLTYTIRTGTTIPSGYTFSNTVTWGDEFDYNGTPDSSKWGLDSGNGYFGWGNNELEYHRPENVIVSGNTLRITAKNESYEGFSYTSAKLDTRNIKFQYGRFDFRAKLPVTGGMWPAVFMFGQDYRWYNLQSWPQCGEIDIMELSGNNPNIVQTNIHRGAGSVLNQVNVGSTANQFNNYRIDWTPDYIKWFINDVQVNEFVNNGGGHSDWPFNDYFNLILTLNVGGNFTGAVDAGALPQVLEFDYIRYYALEGGYNTAPPTTSKPASPVLASTSGTKKYSEWWYNSVTSKPAGSTIKWYIAGVFAVDGDNIAAPPEVALGTYVGACVATVDGVDSEPTVYTISIIPD